MREYTMPCVVCGKDFLCRHRSALYCPECKVKVNKERDRERYNGLKAPRQPRKEKPHIVGLNEMVARAKAANMKYGDYVAMIEMGARYENL